MKNYIKSLLVLTLGFSFGISAFLSKFTNIHTQRDPAALNGKVFQISNLSNEEIRYQLQSKMKVLPTIEGKKSIAFSGFSSVLCKTYSTIEVEFVAEGVSVAGEPPKLKISYPCEAGQDPSELASLYLPVDRILGEKPHSADFKFDGYNATVTLTNSADEWPHQWVLERVEFKNVTGENKKITFDRSPASVDQAHPIVLEF